MVMVKEPTGGTGVGGGKRALQAAWRSRQKARSLVWTLARRPHPSYLIANLTK